MADNYNGIKCNQKHFIFLNFTSSTSTVCLVCVHTVSFRFLLEHRALECAAWDSAAGLLSLGAN